MKKYLFVIILIGSVALVVGCKNASEKTKTPGNGKTGDNVKTLKTEIMLDDDDDDAALEDFPLKPGGEKPSQELLKMWEDFDKENAKKFEQSWIKTKKFINRLTVIIEGYKADNKEGLYPEPGESQDNRGTESLAQLINDGIIEIKDVWLSTSEPKVLIDVWDKPLRYVPWGNLDDKKGAHNPDNFDLWSSGPDGTWGTVDDVTNWKKAGKKDK